MTHMCSVKSILERKSTLSRAKKKNLVSRRSDELGTTVALKNHFYFNFKEQESCQALVDSFLRFKA